MCGSRGESRSYLKSPRTRPYRVFLLAEHNFIYGDNEVQGRKDLGTELRQIAGITANQPWFVLGLEDLTYRGFKFTRNNKREGSRNIHCKLDRILINDEWLQNLRDGLGLMDYQIIYPLLDQGKCYWMRCKDFAPLLVASWQEESHCSPMLKLSLKLKRLKTHLRQFNKKLFSNTKIRIVEAKEKLDRTQADLQIDPRNTELHQRGKSLSVEYAELSLAEEAFFQQKARVKWLHVGDQDTVYFHRKVNGNRLRTKILSIIDRSGRRLEDPDEVKQEVVSFFQDLLGTSSPYNPSYKARITNVIKLNEVQKRDLCKEVGADEIREALFSIQGDKAPGPDGYCAAFFQKNWQLVGQDVIQAVSHFF
ncbi:hypothetical protein F0562_013585 [Nyssa sinensis]|uniref:Reverse transcriptase domain-containing protein n=1 Tax=Nyssa sinensis TaxID=561372 RepID=A0A5J4ZMZ7_9ASTE|nr:hypothetical protein F0562_013585 [Nyssa sinensis]